MTTATTTAGLARLTPSLLVQYLSARPGLDGRTRAVVLLRAQPEWDGPDALTYGGGQRAAVAAAPSPLAVHEQILGHLHSAGDGSGPRVLVVLTDCEEATLDPGLLARVWHNGVRSVDNWEVVRTSFGAGAVDHRLQVSDGGWAAEALLEAAPLDRWPKIAGGTLTRDHALAQLVQRRLGLGRYADPADETQDIADDRIGLTALLRWAVRPGAAERFLALRDAERDGLAAFLCEKGQAGPAATVLFGLIGEGHGTDALAYGLVAAGLWSHTASPGPEVYRARGRAELWAGGQGELTPEESDARFAQYGTVAEAAVDTLVARDDRRVLTSLLQRADVLACQFGAEQAAAVSLFLPLGFETRAAEAGAALATGDPHGIAQAVRAWGEHRHAVRPEGRARVERARMARRLAAWLTDATEQPQSVEDWLRLQITDTAWADFALDRIEAGGEDASALRDAYDRLGEQVRERRREMDRAFAQRLAVWTESGGAPGSLLTVEDFLDRVAAPAARGKDRRRLLIVVVDGMTSAIAAELGQELRERFSEYDPFPEAEGRPRRRAVAAALPSVTAVSRTSLFAGRLLRGAQADEKRLFPQHPFAGPGRAAAVFHKDDLRAERTGSPFSAPLESALHDGRTHVAVVLNTIDDRLAKEQRLGATRWSVDEIGFLGELLDTAAAEGMAVLLLSDHGHVVDRRDRRVSVPEAADRYRPHAEGELDEREIRLRGPRVVAPEPGGTVIALWDADSRYTGRKAGYHGGASLAEIAIPLQAYLPFGATPPEGWRELGDPAPPWWSPDRVAEVPATPAPAPAVAAAPAPARRRPPKSKQVTQEESLFAEPAGQAVPAPAVPVRQTEPAVPSDPHTALVDALMSSEIFEAQLKLVGRTVDLGKVRAAVQELLTSRTLPLTALAQRAGERPVRAAGFAAVLRQLLNHDGEQVVEILPDNRTLRLNEPLLKAQFGL
ncbi:BREX-2 system phosphatase PglZ [Streptomyces ferrugineus]|uniref:BREX-2 system phosphatase PglZ n=1 Tax=Streptomyces ferrugineus TaxID=1413221 RepID=A0A7M2SRU9_9ACTN|nr:BREX-2 system phosphatase PglZ [Streptomyces ferrugineus]QOV38719.1 BREX-2 system phosphatase PglZ [Streptomyces ferrugineus]